MKSQSETELKGKVNIIQSETEIEGKVNQTQSETELEGVFHCSGSSLCFHPRRLLLGGPPLGLDLPLPLDPHSLITSALAFCSLINLTAASKTRLSSSIMAL